MNYTLFKNEMQKQPLIFSADLVRFHKKPQVIRNQLTRWSKKGLLLSLKRGVYLLNRQDRKINLSRSFIANQLYSPSYVSLEFALQFYELIPEGVSTVTSVTTKKTAHFINVEGHFTYQHIQAYAYHGFLMVKDTSSFSFLMAKPEKAIVDFLYLNLDSIQENDPNVFESSYRFQNLEDLNLNLTLSLGESFRNRKLTRVLKCFCQFAGGERSND